MKGRGVRHVILTVMSYVTWQFSRGPRWIIQFSWTLQRALLQLFSVPLMLQTLFQHWRKDITAYRGTLGERFQILLLNLISRAAGFIIRTSLLFVWFISALVLIPITLAVLTFFFFWPLLALAFMVTGIGLIIIAF